MKKHKKYARPGKHGELWICISKQTERQDCFKIVFPLEEKNELKGIGDRRDARFVTSGLDTSILVFTSTSHLLGYSESWCSSLRDPKKSEWVWEKETFLRVASKLWVRFGQYKLVTQTCGWINRKWLLSIHKTWFTTSTLIVTSVTRIKVTRFHDSILLWSMQCDFSKDCISHEFIL